jgi:hypothetical protein
MLTARHTWSGTQVTIIIQVHSAQCSAAHVSAAFCLLGWCCCCASSSVQLHMPGISASHTASCCKHMKLQVQGYAGAAIGDATPLCSCASLAGVCVTVCAPHLSRHKGCKLDVLCVVDGATGHSHADGVGPPGCGGAVCSNIRPTRLADRLALAFAHADRRLSWAAAEADKALTDCW